MRVLGVAVVLLGVVAAATTTSSTAGRVATKSPGPQCGGVLWRLMTLSDPDRMRVKFDRLDTTIADISKLAAPKGIAPVRSTSFQRQVWDLRVVIDRYRIASNGEIILVVYSIVSAQYMDVYLPNPHCLGPRARDRSGMVAARRAFTAHCPPATAAWQLLGATVDLAGVGFWNPSRSTRGAMPSGAELRPLTNLRIVAGCGVG